MGIEVDHCVLSVERLPFEDDTFDCVVSTFTLCSIENVELAVGDIVAAHRFASVDSNKFYLEKMPKTHGYAYRGIATK
jgi:ubiquinone/menaquinone biosynthesis C-methylase UbiE